MKWTDELRNKQNVSCTPAQNGKRTAKPPTYSVVLSTGLWLNFPCKLIFRLVNIKELGVADLRVFTVPYHAHSSTTTLTVSFRGINQSVAMIYTHL